MEFDDVFKIIGKCGKRQKLHILLLGLLGIFFAFHMLLLAFVGKEPSVHCKGRSDEDTCSEEAPPCDEYVYGSEFTSIVTEFDLVCKNAYKVGVSQSVFMGGVLVGAQSFGILADMYGRKTMLVIGLQLMALSGSVCALTQTFVQFTTIRFLSGISTGGTILVQFVLLSELLSPSVRAPILTAQGLTFPFGIVVYAVSAFLIPNWRWLTLLVSFPMLACVAFHWLIPESPRWLVSKGRISEAEDILYDIGVGNGEQITRAQITLSSPNDGKTNKKHNVMDCFKTPELRKRMLIGIFTWFTVSMVYYGLTMNASNLGGNMYISFSISGIVEVPAQLFILTFINKWGRKRLLIGSSFLSGVACMMFTVLPQEIEDYANIGTSLAMVGKLGASAMFGCVYIHMAELLPTVLRNSGMGVCSMAARFGGIVAPSVLPLGDFMAYLIFGSFGIFSGILSFKLPETLGKSLPETIEDVESEAPSNGSLKVVLDDEEMLQQVEDKINLLEAEEGLVGRQSSEYY